ncbi:signal peptidase complex-like protein DTM1 isoform X1 [Phoenix dactylifera]|uniref:Signal peptidase complex-like protein DTM1 isoform X1 n=1 Tax=Phoenix dactylifera TaxID=42345 RepID=A0A8B7CBB4_PHODC|nr:signal peptidase complex-like protein DTM1 isoform X1 [Phoenix dactylifera]
MGRDGALQSCLVALAVVVIVVGVWTFSFQKMMATYFLGLLGIAGILLPDWEFFDRDFSQWFTPLPARRGAASNLDPDAIRFKFSPLRVAAIAIIYGFGLYKWWMFVIS